MLRWRRRRTGNKSKEWIWDTDSFKELIYWIMCTHGNILFYCKEEKWFYFHHKYIWEFYLRLLWFPFDVSFLWNIEKGLACIPSHTYIRHNKIIIMYFIHLRLVSYIASVCLSVIVRVGGWHPIKHHTDTLLMPRDKEVDWELLWKRAMVLIHNYFILYCILILINFLWWERYGKKCVCYSLVEFSV